MMDGVKYYILQVYRGRQRIQRRSAISSRSKKKNHPLAPTDIEKRQVVVNVAWCEGD